MKFKKPKFWDLKKPNLFALVIYPLTFIIHINNFFLNKKKPKNKIKSLKTICVGNIYLGGTGKTPTVIGLYEILKNLDFKVAVGKKFYPDHLDEEILLKKKTKLISDNNRSKILNKAADDNLDIVIFDDGLQDKKIFYDLEFVCFDSENWIGNGCLIPAGPLRENLTSLNKYDAVFLKNLKDKNKNIIQDIKNINPNIKIFSTFYDAINLEDFNKSEKYLIFSGIGNPKSFKKLLLEKNLNVIEEIIYPDHHKYNKKDINNIKHKAKINNAKIITTEKDFVKIAQEDQIDIKYLKIEFKINEKDELIKFLNNSIND